MDKQYGTYLLFYKLTNICRRTLLALVKDAYFHAGLFLRLECASSPWLWLECIQGEIMEVAFVLNDKIMIVILWMEK